MNTRTLCVLSLIVVVSSCNRRAPEPTTATAPKARAHYEYMAPPPPSVVATAAPAKSERHHLSPASPQGVVAEPQPADFDKGSFDTESYDRIDENPFRLVAQAPLSTFSIDVDTASYANVRRFLEQGSLPHADAVRVEELINYFTYDYPEARGQEPFSVTLEAAACPWDLSHRLVRVGLRGRTIPEESRQPANLVFLLDVSGSMNDPSKLPLLQSALAMLVQNLSDRDRVAIVVYAGASGLVLPSTPCGDRPAILEALSRLQAGGSTNGGAGIELAYDVARQSFIEGGVNRVILATDGDFNVGTTSRGELTRLIEEKAKSGVFLTVLGFGMGNLKDATLEELSGRGNGNYAYIDSEAEARKVLVEQMGANLVTIAKDVKIQVEFNPAQVAAYRLVGYENRMLRAEDFNDDRKDAGEIGAGHTVTALYEIVPAGVPVPGPSVDPLKYQEPAQTAVAAGSGELLTLKLRFKEPDGDESRLISFTLADQGAGYDDASGDFRFAAAVAAFGMVLRDSPHRGTATYDTALELGADARGDDPHGYRGQFLELVRTARELSTRQI